MNPRIALLSIVVLMAGCGGGGSTTSTPNNAASTIVTLETATGAIVPNTVVTLSTGISSSNVPTGVLATQTTDANGQATFTNLPATGLLCVNAVIVTSNTNTFAGQCFEPFPAAYTLI